MSSIYNANRIGERTEPCLTPNMILKKFENARSAGEFGAPQQIQTGFASWLLASLLHGRRSLEANQTLHDIWPSPWLVHYIHFRGFLPLKEFCQVHNSLCVQVLHSPTLGALLHGTRAVGVT